jgi:hypothetical protein
MRRLLSSPACGLLAKQESAALSSSALLRPLTTVRGAVPLSALAGDPREGRDGRGLTGSRSPP